MTELLSGVARGAVNVGADFFKEASKGIAYMTAGQAAKMAQQAVTEYMYPQKVASNQYTPNRPADYIPIAPNDNLASNYLPVMNPNSSQNNVLINRIRLESYGNSLGSYPRTVNLAGTPTNMPLILPSYGQLPTITTYKSTRPVEKRILENKIVSEGVLQRKESARGSTRGSTRGSNGRKGKGSTTQLKNVFKLST